MGGGGFDSVNCCVISLSIYVEIRLWPRRWA
jgi:hypothetical protein